MDGSLEDVVEGLVVGAEAVDDHRFQFLHEKVEISVDESEIEFGDVAQCLEALEPFGKLRLDVVVVALEVRVLLRPLSVLLQRLRQLRFVQFYLALCFGGCSRVVGVVVWEGWW